MTSCEKCWGDAYMETFVDPMKGQSEHYSDLIKERKDNPCTPEEQAGTGASICPKCSRKTIHIYTHECVNCGYSNKQINK